MIHWIINSHHCYVDPECALVFAFWLYSSFMDSQLTRKTIGMSHTRLDPGRVVGIHFPHIRIGLWQFPQVGDTCWPRWVRSFLCSRCTRDESSCTCSGFRNRRSNGGTPEGNEWERFMEQLLELISSPNHLAVFQIRLLCIVCLVPVCCAVANIWVWFSGDSDVREHFPIIHS